ncbi:MAG: tetratricopeptide repeat protein [Armatimonadetes bacterium]|nr:tetratricopeptide repeat protein [Armatimonadota bacterium]
MARCRHCEREVDDTDAFCRHCGAALTTTESPLSPPRAPSRALDDMAADFLSRLKDKPEDPDALYNLALTRYYARDWAAAAEYLVDFVRLVPEFADAHGKLALCYWHLGRREAALVSIRQAVSLAPNDRRLADIATRMAEADEA